MSSEEVFEVFIITFIYKKKKIVSTGCLCTS